MVRFVAGLKFSGVSAFFFAVNLEFSSFSSVRHGFEWCRCCCNTNSFVFHSAAAVATLVAGAIFLLPSTCFHVGLLQSLPWWPWVHDVCFARILSLSPSPNSSVVVNGRSDHSLPRHFCHDFTDEGNHPCFSHSPQTFVCRSCDCDSSAGQLQSSGFQLSDIVYVNLGLSEMQVGCRLGRTLYFVLGSPLFHFKFDPRL